ncbi:MAG: ATP-binding protein [Bacteroidota bacterium]
MGNFDKNQFKALSNSLNSNSFKVKPIFLEFQNYNYHHTSAPGGEERIKERFVGRKKIINKLLSYIHESTSNTGAYLITGFRGMGKTLVVNKALATLNPISKSGSYFSYWILLVPVVIFWANIQGVAKGFIEEYPGIVEFLGFLSLIVVFILGYQDPRNERIFNTQNNKVGVAYRFWYYFTRGIKYGFVALFNPIFERSKHSFSRNLRFIAIFIWIVSGLVLFDYFVLDSTLTRHEAFWCLNHFLIYTYMAISIYTERLEYLKYSISPGKALETGNAKEFLFAAKINCVELIALSTWLFFWISSEVTGWVGTVANSDHGQTALQGFIFLALISHLYLFAKLSWKRKRLQQDANVYATTMSTFRTLFDFQHHIIVRVNLGKDNLSEKEVLKFITNELYREYSQWFHNIKSVKRIVNVFLLAFLVYMVSAGIYNGFLDKRFSDFSRETLKLGRYFPSQYMVGEQGLKLVEMDKLFSESYDGDPLDTYLSDIVHLSEHSKKSSAEIPIGYKELEQSLLLKDSIGKANMVFEKWYSPIRIDSRKVSYPKMSYSLWESFHVSLTKICNKLDYFTLKLWHSTRKIFLSSYFEPLLSKRFELPKALVNKIYPKVPILSVYLLMITLVFAFWLIPNKFRFIKGHGSTLRALKKIKDQIDASITFEQGGNASSLNTSWFSFRKQLSYQPLDAKDISQKLIHLLDDIHSLPFLFTKAKFVVVFDELDKISPIVTTDLPLDKDDDQESDSINGRYETRRKERISRILSSMKHFFNSAKAKFIFIAGREMYDAALAGISDRESSLDSIFNENKIYVNSFYTEIEDNNLSDLTSITEKYLCQFLIPAYYQTRQGGQSNLKAYRDYLFEYFGAKKQNRNQNFQRPLAITDNRYLNVLIWDHFKEEVFRLKDRIKEALNWPREPYLNEPDVEAKINKIIMVLKDFIVYLTYRSNGAPKKLSNLLERYLTPVKDKEFKPGDVLYVGNTDENLYLEIGYYSQYKVTLVSYLTTPIFLGLGKYMHEYSDKLLVSISYMLDHLYKFHKSGLSYRSLSLTPEIVDVDKEPQFREFLDKLVHSLSKNHLRPIVSGMYDYKFNGDITSEISFLSKIDELEAAAFNFTLDESIELKRHFSRRLEHMMSVNSTPVVIKNANREYDDHINAQSLLNVMLGDLHFHDEEYHEAVTHYLDSIQILRQRDVEHMNLYDFVLFVRNKLKLALAFEKNKMYDNALMTYSEITDLVLRKRSIPLKRFGLARFVIKKTDLQNSRFFDDIVYYERLFTIGYKWYSDPENKDNELIVIGRLKQERLDKETNENNNYLSEYQWNTIFSISDMEAFYTHDVKILAEKIENMAVNQYPLKLYFLQSTLENIRVLYQPIIAKLYLMEKSGSEKLKDIDLNRAIAEFNFLKIPLKTKEKRVVVSEFYNKIGDILYFKNGTLNIFLKKQLVAQLDGKGSVENNRARNLLMAPIDAIFCYIKSLAILLIPCHEKKEKERTKIKLEKFYMYSDEGSREKTISCLKEFLKGVKDNLEEIQQELDKMLENKSIRDRYSHEYLGAIANCVVDLTDALSCFVLNESNDAFSSIGEISMIYKCLCKKEHEILQWYYRAYELYRDLEEYRLAKAQLLKIIYSIQKGKIEQVVWGSKGKRNFVQLCDDCIRLIYQTYNDSHHMEIEKIKEFVGPKGLESNITKNSIAMAEISEIVNLYKIREYQHHKAKDADFEQKKTFYRYVYQNINPYAMVGRKQDRIIELNLRLRANRDLFDNSGTLDNGFLAELGFTQEDIATGKKDWIRYFLILDSLGACNELLKTIYLLDIDYVVTYNLMLAQAHNKMAFWCSELKKIPEDKKIRELLRKKVLNSESLMHLSEVYHLNLALQANKNAKSFHTRGDTLNTFLKDTSYLDDFFNDNQVHFLIAFERRELQQLQWKSPKENPVDEIVAKLDEPLIREVYSTEAYCE